MRKSLLVFLLFLISSSAFASEVQIVSVLFIKQPHSWVVRTTLRHDDTGWKHYADAWRIVAEKHGEIAKRVLFHPHVNEQPFTRSLENVKIPDDVHIVYVEAHDTESGWSSDRVKVDLTKSDGVRYQIKTH